MGGNVRRYVKAMSNGMVNSGEGACDRFLNRKK